MEGSNVMIFLKYILIGVLKCKRTNLVFFEIVEAGVVDVFV